MKEILTKIDSIKQKVGKISKDSENPFFKSKYFDINSLLEHLEPLLQAEGLVLLQPIRENQVTSEIIDIESNQAVSSSMTLPDITDPQKLGSAITYFRRYTLQSLLALQSGDDDDGNMASGRDSVKKDVAYLASDKQTKFVKDLFKDRLGIDLSQDLAQKDFKRVCKFDVEAMTGKQARDLIEALQDDKRSEVIYQKMQGKLD